MSVRRALFFSYLEKYGSYVLALGSTVVLSRLLSPSDVGAFSIGMALVGMVAVFREFGVSTYLAQEVELTADRVAAAFTLTVGMGFLLALVVAALATPAAAFYGDARLQLILFILAVNFALAPLGSVSQSLLTRELRFGVLAWVRLAYGVVSAAVSIGLAWWGLGPQSLAWGALCGTVVTGVVSFAAHPHSLNINLRRSDLKRVFDVGVPVTLVAIVDDLINTVPDLVVGRWQGLAAAGLLSRARGLSQMAYQLIARATGPVFLAVFSKRKREGAEVEQFYVNATSCVCAVGWTLLACLGALASPLVHLLYGPQWKEVAPLLPWLCAAAAVFLLTSGAHVLLLAHGGAKDALHAKLWALPFYLGCGVVGAMVSLQAMVIATLLATAAATGLQARAVKLRVGLSITSQLRPLITSSLPAISAGSASLAVALWYANSDASAWAAVIIGGMASAIAAVAGVAIKDSPLRQELLTHWRARRQAA